MFHTRDLRYFVAVAEHLHFTRAADSLFVTQSAVSKQIAGLERSLGALLFVRRHDGVILTPAGETLLPYAREILALSEGAADAVYRTASSARELTIGFWLAPGNGVLSQAIKAFSQQRPGTRLNLRRADWGEGGAGVEAHQADVGLIWTPHGTPVHGLGSYLVAVEDSAMGLPSGHALADREFVTLEDLVDETIFVLPQGTDALSRHSRRIPGPRAAGRQHVITTIDETIESIANGLGVCPLTPSVASAYLPPAVVAVPLRGIDPLDYCIVWRKDDERRPELQDLIRALAQAWRSVYSAPPPRRGANASSSPNRS
jgi:DNA-binding transcriptional LysR family regulator